LSRLTLALGLALLAVEAIVAVWVIASGDEGGSTGVAIALALTAGVTFVVSGLVALTRRPENRTGIYLLAVGYVWFFGALTDSGNEWVSTLGFLLGNLVFAPFTALVLAYPSGRLRTRLERAIPIVTGVLLTTSSLLVLLFDPELADRCDGCPGSAIAIADRPGLADVFDAVSTIGGLALIVLVVAILVRRWRAAGPALRRLLWPVLFSGSATLVAIGLVVIADQFSSRVADGLSILFLLTFASVPFAFLFGILRTRLARSPVSELVLALDSGAPIRDAMAHALNDPSLDLAFRLAAGAGWVDATGRRVPEPVATAGRSLTFVERAGEHIAALVHDESLDESPELVEAVAAAAGLSLQNERLQAELRAQSDELRTITDTAPSVLVNVGTDGRILNQNRAAFAAAGLDDQELVRGRFFWDVFIDPEERDDVVARFEALAPTFAAAEYENTFTNARGERRVIAWKAAPVIGPDGVVESIVAGGIDVSDRRQLEEEKERERAFLNAIANDAPSLLCLVDERGVVAAGASNKTFERTLEYDPEDTGGSVFWEKYIAPEEAADVAVVIARVAAGEVVEARDNTWLTRSGRRLTISWSCTRLPSIDDRHLLLVSGVDVTERKRREAEVQTERDFLSTVANSIPSLLALVDADGVITPHGVNRAFREVTGFEEHELVGRAVWDAVADESDRGAIQDTFHRAVEAGDPLGGESTWRTKVGEPRVVEWVVIPTRDVDGRGRILVSATDVTERTHRELELQRERDATTTVLQAIPSVVAVLDRRFSIRDRDVDNPLAAVNRAFRETLRWRDEDVVDRSFLELIAEDDDERARHALTVAAAGAPSPLVESDWLRADGERVTFEWSAAPVADVTGRTEGLVLVSGVDVTARRAKELEAARRRAFIDTVTDTIPSYLVAVDEEGVVRGDGFNRAFGEAFGWDVAELTGRNLFGSVLDEDDDSARSAIAAAAGGSQEAELESVWRGRDGRERIVAWTAQAVTDVRGQQVVLVSGSDVTERQRRDEELRASRARIVAAGDDARRRLERDLHDGAQQRLVALSVSLRLAESKLTDDPQRAASILTAARDELAHALAELRELARGIHPAVLTDRGLVPALEALVDRSPLPVALDTSLHTALERLPAAIEAAAYFVVSEALVNVSKYAEASAARVGVQLEEGALQVTVEDDGIGGADPARGTGLRGLADRVAALEGTLVVTSRPGAGTCVRADIPVARVRATIPSA
jgi:PAS domain S-box-containing protein